MEFSDTLLHKLKHCPPRKAIYIKEAILDQDGNRIEIIKPVQDVELSSRGVILSTYKGNK